MMIVNCVLSRTCGSCDPLSWMSPEHLRMVFIASLIASAAAAVFAAFHAHFLMAIPFICSAATSYASSYLVERYFTYYQASERLGQSVRELTETRRLAQLALVQSQQQTANRQTQNRALENIVERVETGHVINTELTEGLIANLREENSQGKAQIVALNVQLQNLMEQNVQAEKIKAGLEAQIVEANGLCEKLRNESVEWRDFQIGQAQISEEGQAHLKEARLTMEQTCQLGKETEERLARTQGITKVVSELKQDMLVQGGQLLRVRELLAEAQRQG